MKRIGEDVSGKLDDASGVLLIAAAAGHATCVNKFMERGVRRALSRSRRSACRHCQA